MRLPFNADPGRTGCFTKRNSADPGVLPTEYPFAKTLIIFRVKPAKYNVTVAFKIEIDILHHFVRGAIPWLRYVNLHNRVTSSGGSYLLGNPPYSRDS